MTFRVYTDDGKVYGPYSSLPVAQQQARAKLAENTKRKLVEIRPAFGGNGPFNKRTAGSIYRARKDYTK